MALLPRILRHGTLRGLKMAMAVDARFLARTKTTTAAAPEYAAGDGHSAAVAESYDSEVELGLRPNIGLSLHLRIHRAHRSAEEGYYEIERQKHAADFRNGSIASFERPRHVCFNPNHCDAANRRFGPQSDIPRPVEHCESGHRTRYCGVIYSCCRPVGSLSIIAIIGGDQ
jgi:hypothetical protein